MSTLRASLFRLASPVQRERLADLRERAPVAVELVAAPAPAVPVDAEAPSAAHEPAGRVDASGTAESPPPIETPAVAPATEAPAPTAEDGPWWRRGLRAEKGPPRDAVKAALRHGAAEGHPVEVKLGTTRRWYRGLIGRQLADERGRVLYELRTASFVRCFTVEDVSRVVVDEAWAECVKGLLRPIRARGARAQIHMIGRRTVTGFPAAIERHHDRFALLDAPDGQLVAGRCVRFGEVVDVGEVAEDEP